MSLIQLPWWDYLLPPCDFSQHVYREIALSESPLSSFTARRAVAEAEPAECANPWLASWTLDLGSFSQEPTSERATCSGIQKSQRGLFRISVTDLWLQLYNVSTVVAFALHLLLRSFPLCCP